MKNKIFWTCLYPIKKSPPTKLAVGELENHQSSDSAWSLYIHQRLPDHGCQGYNGAKNTETSDYDAFAPTLMGFLQPRIQFRLDSILIIIYFDLKRKAIVITFFLLKNTGIHRYFLKFLYIT